MKLPNAKLAFIDLNKLQNYSLNPQHDRGKHKARLFLAILGLSASDAKTLATLILEAIQLHDVISSTQDGYGQRYLVDFPVSRNQQTALLRTTWIIRPTETFPRLTSCYILR
ncbi:MAG: hypothetical protein KME07_03495 [Pegethrix bostrychoides GSE-TBD4-15B]|jgi:hypothetical protein|uniref:DUF6883 domain-containing protein n=1 Tax=Pegethrix bostrychoides GSE-TBD4-15B TaxID=2839662 RepID=A0A951U3E1_9CYAN|nr:hypothetical protein [Pegethrix bostrychoides GSE-TBD4-15B]